MSVEIRCPQDCFARSLFTLLLVGVVSFGCAAPHGSDDELDDASEAVATSEDELSVLASIDCRCVYVRAVQGCPDVAQSVPGNGEATTTLRHSALSEARRRACDDFSANVRNHLPLRCKVARTATFSACSCATWYPRPNGTGWYGPTTALAGPACVSPR